MLFLGIDIGTSGIRSAVVDGNGKVVSSARALHLPQPTLAIDAELWWAATCNCIKEQLTRLATDGFDLGDIVGITVDGTSGSMVMTDQDLTPVTQALMYNSSGFESEATQIAKVAPAVHIAKGSNSALARALRLVKGDTGNRTKHLLHQADFIAAKLIGFGGHSDVMNSLKTGVDPETGIWPDWIHALLPADILPVAHPLGAVIGQTCNKTASLLGISAGVNVHAGTTDSIGAFLAAAPLKKGVGVTSLGSTLAIKLMSDTRIEVPRLGLYSHRVGHVWLVGGASNTGGRVLRHFFTDGELSKLSAMIDPEVDSGLDYYPLIEPGERFPVSDPDLPPRLSPRPLDPAKFLHGIFEGIARIEALCYKIIADQGAAMPAQIISVGGGAANDTFARIRARHLGQLPVIAAESEAAVGTARIPLIAR